MGVHDCYIVDCPSLVYIPVAFSYNSFLQVIWEELENIDQWLRDVCSWANSGREVIDNDWL